MTSDGIFQLSKKFTIEVAAIEGQRSQFLLIRKRLNEGNATFSAFLQIIMSEEQVSELGITFETFSKERHGRWAHLIVTHENLLNVCIGS